MNVDCLRIREDRFLEPVAFEGMTPQWAEQEALHWLDVQGADSTELLELLGVLYLPPRILARLEEGAAIPVYEVFDRAVFMSLPLPAYRAQLSSGTFMILIVRNTLITMHQDDVPLLTEIREEVTGYTRLASASIEAMVFQLMLRVNDVEAQTFMEVRRDIDRLASSIEEAPTEVEMDAILALKRQVSHLATACEDMTAIVQVIRSIDSRAFKAGDQLLNFSLLVDRYQQFHRAVTRFESRLNDMRNQYTLGLQESTNVRLRILTVISAVFLPLTLLAGIYGMNFDPMPGLHNRYGYFIVVAIMIVLLLGMLTYFYVKGWFKS